MLFKKLSLPMYTVNPNFYILRFFIRPGYILKPNYLVRHKSYANCFSAIKPVGLLRSYITIGDILPRCVLKYFDEKA